MSDHQTHCFEASIARFQALRETVERTCAEAGVSRDAAGRLIVVLEELFANTVQHGYSRLPASPEGRWVWIALNCNKEGIEVVYEDEAPEHDPFAGAATPDYSGAVDSWRIGGVGLALVLRLGRKLSYRRAGGRNRIEFVIPMRHGSA